MFCCTKRVEDSTLALGESPLETGEAHRTHIEELYEVTESCFDLPQLRGELLQWEWIYNTKRPHQALGYLTPLEFLEQGKAKQTQEVMCH